MKFHIKSNFFVPGLEDLENIDFDRSHMSMREFLEALSMMSPDHLEYLEAGATELNPDDWEVDINGIPYEDYDGGLEYPLKDGDTVTIRIIAQGGG